jgi:Zn ribbon nucleic-acid-binding protein
MPKARVDQTNRNFMIVAAVVVIGAGLAMFLVSLADRQTSPEALAKEQLAQCLTSKGFRMYGAYWCGHCNEQKKMFGKAVSQVDYVECAVRGNPQQQVPECQEAAIESYPTWTYGDDQRIPGLVPLEQLATIAGCDYSLAGAVSESADQVTSTIELTADGEDVTTQLLDLETEPVE